MRAITCLLPIIGLCAPARAEEDVAALASRAQRAAVGIVCRGPQGSYFGTGTIIRSDGVILTSTTVLPPGAVGIFATLSDGRVVPATLLAVDTAKECALAQIEGTYATCLPLRTEAPDGIGQIVFSLGNAFGVAGGTSGDGRVSVCAGILSGRYTLSETRSEATYKGAVLETDAPLNPGSDGGALIDTSGAVIGILSLNYSPMRFLGTVIPAQSVMEFIEATVGKVPVVPGETRQALPRVVINLWARRVVALEVARGEDVRARAGGFLPGGLDILKRRQPEVFTRPRGCVSGVCIGKDGRILTSWYNVAGAVTRIRARDQEGAWVDCTLLASSEIDDLALVRASGGVWEAAELAGAGPIAAGTAVFAIGRSPDPAAPTVTSGIVSAALRNNDRFLQHDAAANFGNSGGALVDREGRFLGLVAYVGHVWPEWALNSGIGFGVRPERIAEALPALEAGESLPSWSELPFLGVRSTGPEGAVGDVVIGVMPGSAAEKAGLVSGDAIVRVAGVEVKSWREVIRALGAYRAGDKIAVTVKRGGERKLFGVTLAARPEGA